MRVRVEELALKIRVPRETSHVSAQIPSLERNLNARLADELARELGAIEHAGEEVLVVREAVARVTLRLAADARDANSVEKVSQAARNAVIALLTSGEDNEDDVRRFPSDAAFVGAFVVELLGGSAWDRWYFETFRRFRGVGSAETLGALLADAETDVMALFAWLEARGRLADVLQLIGPTGARALASSGLPSTSLTLPPELAPLAAAAFDIASVLGSHVFVDRHRELLAEFYRLEPDRPNWTMRASLTEWVWRFVSWIAKRHGATRDVPDMNGNRSAALATLLEQKFGWLDGEWLQAQALAEHPQSAEAISLNARDHVVPAISPGHAEHFENLAVAITSGALRIDVGSEAHDQIVVRLLATIRAASSRVVEQPDSALISILDSLVSAAQTAFVAAQKRKPSATAKESQVDAPVQRTMPIEQVVQVGQKYGEPALHLIRALVGPSDESRGRRSPFAGLYLLVRPIADLRLEFLAARAGVPWRPLLSALASKLVGASAPFDEATTLWLNSSESGTAELEEKSLRVLNGLVMRSLFDQRLLRTDDVAVSRFDWRGQSFVALSNESGTCWPISDELRGAMEETLMTEWREITNADPLLLQAVRSPLVDLDALVPNLSLPVAVDVLVSSLAVTVLHVMSYWLPGISGSSAPFLVRNCLIRSGSVAVTDESVVVVLEHAPLDIVLEMAGCFAPVENIGWLGRRVRFSFATQE